MKCARNYENLLNFIKVVPKILAVPFFPDAVYKRVRVYVCVSKCSLITQERVGRLSPNFRVALGRSGDSLRHKKFG